jgi:hypothetical protein
MGIILWYILILKVLTNITIGILMLRILLLVIIILILSLILLNREI